MGVKKLKKDQTHDRDPKKLSLENGANNPKFGFQEHFWFSPEKKHCVYIIFTGPFFRTNEIMGIGRERGGEAERHYTFR